MSASGAEGQALHAVPEVATEKQTIAQAVRDAMLEEMERDERVIVLGEDVGVDGGVFRATDGLIERFGAERVIDTPLAESSTGHQPTLRPRRPHAQPYPRDSELPNGGANAIRRRHPPAGAPLGELRGPIPQHAGFQGGRAVKPIRRQRPPDLGVLFMEPKRVYRAFREAVPAEAYTVPLGRAAVAREGTDVTLIAWGAMVRVCLDASEVLAREEISAEVVDLRTLNPLDRETMISSVVKTGRAVVVHEAPRTGGFGAEISAQIHEHAMLQLEAPVQRVAGFDVVFPLAHNEKLYLPSRDRIVKAVEKVLAF